jgi:hypothetical protein
MSTARNGLAAKWTNYWFPNAPLLDLAILRIIAIGTQLGLMLFDDRYGLANLALVADVPESFYKPLPFFMPIAALFGGHRFSILEMQNLQIATVIVGAFALIGLFSRLSVPLFAAGCTIIQFWILSHGDIHHPEAAMVVTLCFLALSPSGRVLSADALLKKRSFREQLLATDREGKWAVLLLQWFFGLMYLSAFWAKLHLGKGDWQNGFTLQYYLAEDGMRWDPLLGLWMSHFHTMSLIGQWFILFFQGTFFISLLFPKLKWFYVPIGMAMHIGIYLMFEAPFFQWIALYLVFVPWTAVLLWLGWISTDEASEAQLAKASAGPTAAA